MQKKLFTIWLTFQLLASMMLFFVQAQEQEIHSDTFYATLSDGYIENSNGSYSSAHDALTGTEDDNTNVFYVGQKYNHLITKYTVYRGFLYFDTSSIPDDATITHATLSLSFSVDMSNNAEFDLTLQNGQPSSPHDPLQSDDYYYGNYLGDGGKLNTTNLHSGYNNLTLNSAGISWIDKTGTTKLCIRSSRDIESVTPYGIPVYDEYVIFYSVDHEFQLKPKLTVTYYTLPELIIDAPSSVQEGEAFLVTVTANNNPVENAEIEFHGSSYFTDSNGIVNITAPFVSDTTEYEIIAIKIGYESTTDIIAIRDTSQLIITAPTSIEERNTFVITINADNNPIENVNVTFNDETKMTNSSGQVTFTAPNVDQDGVYSIFAIKSGYQNGTTGIEVIDQETMGWIFGAVYDSSGSPIKDVSMCLRISDSINKCDITGNEGEYYIFIQTGTYTIQASKQGYQTSSKPGITVEKNEAREVNFILERIVNYESESYSDGIRDSIEVAINLGASSGVLGGEINVKPNEQDYNVTLYKELNVEFISIEEEELSFKINADGPGTILAIRIFGEEGFTDISVDYDGEPIESVSFFDIFNLVDNKSDAKFTRILTEHENGTIMYCLIWIPHFSEHTITISTVVEAITFTIAIMMYIVVGIVAIILFAGTIKLRKRLG